MKKGSKMTLEQIQRVRDGLLKSFPDGRIAWNKGKSNTWCIGDKNINWKGGRTKIEMKRDYLKKNPEKVKVWKKNYHLRHKNNPEYILSTNLRKRILKVLGRKKDRDSAIDFLGCSINELKFYLEGKFKDGMTWENHGNEGWHIDHILPLAYFDLTDKEQAKKAFHYTNLQPLWAIENLKKWAKVENIYAR